MYSAKKKEKMNLSIIHLDQLLFQWGGQKTPPREMSVCQYANCKVAYSLSFHLGGVQVPQVTPMIINKTAT